MAVVLLSLHKLSTRYWEHKN